MSGSGLIYAAIALLWAAVLIPMWLRSHDSSTENRSAERFGQAMRVLSRRPGAESDVDPAMERAEARPARRPAARPEPTASRPSAASRRPTRSVSAARRPRKRPSLAHRRARTLLVLVGVAVFLAVVAVIGVIPWWAPVPFVLLAVAFVVHLRLQAMRAEARRRPARRPAARPAEQRPSRPDDIPQSAHATPAAVQRGSRWRSVFAEDSSRAVVVEAKGDAPAVIAEQVSSPGRDKVEVAGEEDWRPNPLPLPTYVTAPKATRPIRVIDLTTPGAWSSGRLFDDEPLADEDLLAAEVKTDELDALLEHEAAPAPKDDDASRRAVGD